MERVKNLKYQLAFIQSLVLIIVSLKLKVLSIEDMSFKFWGSLAVIIFLNLKFADGLVKLLIWKSKRVRNYLFKSNHIEGYWLMKCTCPGDKENFFSESVAEIRFNPEKSDFDIFPYRLNNSITRSLNFRVDIRNRSCSNEFEFYNPHLCKGFSNGTFHFSSAKHELDFYSGVINIEGEKGIILQQGVRVPDLDIHFFTNKYGLNWRNVLINEHHRYLN